VTTADPDRACLHLDFEAFVEVARLIDERADDDADTTQATAYSAEISVWCRACNEPFRWIGVPAGLSPARPMVSVDETTLRAPIRPASSDPDFGMGIPGFAIQQVV